MADIRDYRVSVPSAAIEELHQKLALSKFPDDQDGDGDDWGRGTPVADLKRIVKYWQEEFKWASFEDRLNKLPHFQATMSLEGFDPFEVHFIHQKSASPDAIPLLFVHGCPSQDPLLAESGAEGGILTINCCFPGPGSFLEATKILPLLTAK